MKVRRAMLLDYKAKSLLWIELGRGFRRVLEAAFAFVFLKSHCGFNGIWTNPNPAMTLENTCARGKLPCRRSIEDPLKRLSLSDETKTIACYLRNNRGKYRLILRMDRRPS